jgi:hypothetical protein
VSGAAQQVVGGILAAAAFTLMIAIIWFRWKFWEDRP